MESESWFYFITSVIEDSDFFLSSIVTEVWELENGSNKVINPTLDFYSIGIGLYAVDFNFCSNWSFFNQMLGNKFSIKRMSQNDFLSNKVSKLPNWVIMRYSQVPADTSSIQGILIELGPYSAFNYFQSQFNIR